MDRRFWRWMAFGVVGLAIVVFAQINSLLVAIESDGLRSFGTGVFTGPKLLVFDIQDFQSAIQLWFGDDHASLAQRLILVHVVVDVAFILAYRHLFREFLSKVEMEEKQLNRLVAGVVWTDLAETLSTGLLVAWIRSDGWLLGLIQLLSLLKWVAVGIFVVVALTHWRQATVPSLRTNIQGSVAERTGQLLGPAVGTLTVIVSLFALLIAFPAGGPMEQLPDVLRFQFTEAPVINRLLAMLALGLFVASVAAAGRLATLAVDQPGTVDTRKLLWVVASISAVLLLVVSLANGRFAAAQLAPILVIGGICAAAWVVSRYGTTAGPQDAAHSESVPTSPLAPVLVIGGIWAASSAMARFRRKADRQDGSVPDSGPTELAPGTGSVGPPAGAVQATAEQKSSRIGALAGAVTVIGAVGLVRSTAGALLLGEGHAAAALAALGAMVVLVAAAIAWERWHSTRRITALVLLIATLGLLGGGVIVGDLWFVAGLGVASALLGGIATDRLVQRADVGRDDIGRVLQSALWGSALLVLALAVVLLVRPWLGYFPGTTGVVALGLSVASLAAGGLVWLSRRFVHWGAGKRLLLGPRPPWGVIIVVTWLVAGALNDAPGYHEVRVETSSSSTGRATSLAGGGKGASAFDQWMDAQDGCAIERNGDQVYPLVLVAAPGGGIRAAYWTVGVLDTLFGEQPRSGESSCTSRRLFAISGVSGGSVGAATWLAAERRGVDPVEAVTGMARDEALSATAVGLFRDLLQPFLSFDNGWPDRAELLEDGWTRSAAVKSHSDGGMVDCVFLVGSEATDTCDLGAASTMWSHLSKGATDWSPVVVFNGSSVTDGCRTLVSSVAALPSSTMVDCFTSSGGSGTVTGSLDVLQGLQVAGTTCSGTPDIRVTSAALLSARFPLVSPSGAVRRHCGDQERVSYVVDGGYYENSGLLTLVQMWEALEPAIVRHNATVAEIGGVFVEPWIVFAPNGYRSTAGAKPPARPRELLLPLTTLSNARSAISEAALEQAALAAMDGFQSPLCEQGARCFSVQSAYVRLGPTLEPSAAAPLGWVLSAQSRRSLDCELEQAFRPKDEDDQSNVQNLLTAIGLDLQTLEFRCTESP